MKPIIVAFLMLICVVFIDGCTIGSGSSTAFQKPAFDKAETDEPSPDTFAITGTITHVKLEGGFFAIMGDDGSKYDPVNLPEAFRKDGLQVKATARLRNDIMSVHMHGKIIEIVDIKEQ